MISPFGAHRSQGIQMMNNRLSQRLMLRALQVGFVE